MGRHLRAERRDLLRRVQAVPIGHVEGNKNTYTRRFELDVPQGSKFSGSIVPTSRTTEEFAGPGFYGKNSQKIKASGKRLRK